MLDFEVQRCTRQCCQTERELAAGETFYSVLLRDGADVVRRDYSAEAWQGPPEDAVGWWKSQMPQPNAQKVNWAPNDVILHYFQQLEQQPDQADLRFVLALLLVRRRLMRLETSETDPLGHEVLVLFSPRDETEHRVLVQEPAPQRVEEIQQELGRLLYAGAS